MAEIWCITHLPLGCDMRKKWALSLAERKTKFVFPSAVTPSGFLRCNLRRPPGDAMDHESMNDELQLEYMKPIHGNKLVFS
jgi:hypothetical protein